MEQIKKRKPVIEVCKGLGFAAVGGLSAGGAIALAEADPLIGTLFAAYPATFSLLTTVLAVDSWEQAFPRASELSEL